MRRPPRHDWSAIYRALAERYGWTFAEIDDMPWTLVFEAVGSKQKKGLRAGQTKGSFAALEKNLQARRQMASVWGN